MLNAEDEDMVETDVELVGLMQVYVELGTILLSITECAQSGGPYKPILPEPDAIPSSRPPQTCPYAKPGLLERRFLPQPTLLHLACIKKFSVVRVTLFPQ